MKKRWVGKIPLKCDICGGPIYEGFVDGRIQDAGCWANMCLQCHRRYGVGLGLGKGQKYNMKGEKIDG